MSTNKNSIVPTFNGYHFFNDVIDQVMKKYDLNLYETIYLKSTYFFIFFNLRKSNDLLESNEVYFDLNLLKKLSYECIRLFKKDYSSEVSHAYVLSRFRNKLVIKKVQDYLTFELNSLFINLSDTKEIDTKLNFDKEIYEYAHYILRRFQAKLICQPYIILRNLNT